MGQQLAVARHRHRLTGGEEEEGCAAGVGGGGVVCEGGMWLQGCLSYPVCKDPCEDAT